MIKKINTITIIILFAVFVASNCAAEKIPDEFSQLVHKWVQAWEDGDVSDYKEFYASSSAAGGKNSTQEYLQDKKNIHNNQQKLWIVVQDLHLTDRKEKSVKLSFRQHYIGSDYSEVGIKKLDLKKTDNGWKIANEKYKPLNKNLQYTVQLIPFQDLDKARKLQKSLAEKDYNHYLIRNAEYNGQNVNILRLGDFKEKNKARRIAKQFKQEHKHYAYVTKVDSVAVVDKDSSGDKEKSNNAENKRSNPNKTDNYGVHIYPFENRKKALKAWEEYREKDIAEKIQYVLIEKDTENKIFGLYACGLEKQNAEKLLQDFSKGQKKTEKMLMEEIPSGDGVLNSSAIDESGVLQNDSSRPISDNVAPEMQNKQLALIYARGDGGPTLGTQSPDSEDSQKENQGPQIGGGESASDASSSSLQKKLEELQKEVESLKKEQKARKSLRISEDEREEREEQLLEAAGREYTLGTKGTLGVEYNFGYSYYSHDVITQLRENTKVEHNANHNLRNTLVMDYALLDNFTIKAQIPFVYKYNKVGTDESQDVTDIGDLSLGAKMQPIKSGGWFPAPIISTTISTPTGRGSYEINPETELATGSSYYTASGSLSLSKPIDPVSLFASLNYSYSYLQEDIRQRRGEGILTDVDPGESVSGSVGFGYSLSYKVSLSLSYSYSYSFETKYKWQDREPSSSGDSISSNLSLSTGLSLTRTRRIIFGVGMGLTDDGSDFNVSLRVPFQFEL